MRPSDRPRGSVPGRMKVTTLNLMTACRAKVSLSPQSSSLRWRVALATMQHICRGGQQPIARTACAPSTTGARRLSTDRRFPSSAGRYWQNPVPGRPGGRPNSGKSLKRRAAAGEFPARANREINRPIREANPTNREAPGNSVRTNRKLSACSSRLAATSSRSGPAGRKRRQGGTTLRPAILGKNLGSIRNCAEYAGGTVMWK